ncbi:DUF4410 domain-containing protein [Paraburkholderia solisilvae]|uniref:Uncharacterized protein n=1 Tax=Paraburkholderia solisilvae TaxID=624376 RepID=A0A6J5EYJ8_9BURK|nr:DUF4410 domain-containing protein [Paraburkholderia solisilvae]CAB3771669.1 hypothetical protein LMG29739_06084 [Paraburkholderia solisilvae]
MRKLLLLPTQRKYILTVTVAVCLVSCTNKTKVDVVHDTTADVRTKPTIVYVMDFDLDASKIKLDPHRGHGLKLVEDTKTPQDEAHELVDLTAESIAEGLIKAGLKALRIPSGAPLAQEGWVVRGSFRQVDEGNRLQRAVGNKGQTDMQIAVTVDDLAVNIKSAPLLQFDTDTNAASSGGNGTAGKGTKSPSAKGSTTLGDVARTIPVGRMSVYSIALKYVLAAHALEGNARQTGARIAEEVAKRIKAIGLSAPAVAPPNDPPRQSDGMSTQHDGALVDER